jgi:hypothetical protein
MDHMIGWVPNQDLREPIIHSRWLAVDRRTQIAVRQRVQQLRWWHRKLVGHSRETTFLGLDSGPAVMRNKLTYNRRDFR